jgi:SnoaL-like domain
MTTRHTIEKWVHKFNAGDAEGISALYADDAVNHQIALEPVVGRAAIEEFHRHTFAGGPLTCAAINLVVDGEWGALEWIDPDGFRGCGFLDPRRADRAPAGLLGQRATSSGSP